MTAPSSAGNVGLQVSSGREHLDGPDGHPDGDPDGDPQRRRLGAAVEAVLGGRALVEYVVLDGHMHAVTVVAGRARLHRLAGLDEVAGLGGGVTVRHQRRVRSRPDPRSAEAGAALLTDTGRRLDALLLAPLRELDARDLVVVPTGPLQAVAWSLLPSSAERAITVVPAAALWVTATSRN